MYSHNKSNAIIYLASNGINIRNIIETVFCMLDEVTEVICSSGLMKMKDTLLIGHLPIRGHAKSAEDNPKQQPNFNDMEMEQ